MADYTQAIRLDPKWARAHCGRGIAHQRRGALDKAIADYTEAIRLDAACAEAYSGRASVFAAKGDCDRAIADFTQVIGINGKSAEAYCNRGIANEVTLRVIWKRGEDEGTAF
jgi:tetratricopeptide (TPR) repeat protein